MGNEQEPDGPSLEPPSLFRRRRKEKPLQPPVDDSPTTILDDTGIDTQADEPTQPLAAPPPAAPVAPPTAAPVAPPPPVIVDEARPPAPVVDEAPPPQPAARIPAERAGPPMTGRAAAAVVGLLVGGLVVGLTTASFGLCNQIRGTNSCGGGGFLLLVAILAIAVVVGSLLLRLCEVPEPGSTSFLAVGLTSVIALLFLVDALFEWWMAIAIPLVSVATYLLSHWVTTTFVEPEREVRLATEPEAVDHDVR